MHAMLVAAIGPAIVPDAMIALALFTRLTAFAMPVVLAMLVNMRCKQSICLYILNAQHV